MKLSTAVAIVTLGVFVSVGGVSAQTSTPSTVQAKPVASPEKTAKSKECSAQADAKGLHGKERKKFRSQCKAGKS
jgi:hypothetical protein